jgi:hypothetical protein
MWFSMYNVFLEQRSSGTLIVKILESKIFFLKSRWRLETDRPKQASQTSYIQYKY